ncbi:MAG: hypothetical protein FJW88_05140 [Actinobacteria bacterium]|nr:hypothetical protein [Actinomycetota bacterium]
MSKQRAAPTGAKRTPTRRSPTAWKPPRDRRRILEAIGAAVGVVVVTVAAIWILKPPDDSTSNQVPVEQPVPPPAVTPADTSSDTSATTITTPAAQP